MFFSHFQMDGSVCLANQPVQRENLHLLVVLVLLYCFPLCIQSPQGQYLLEFPYIQHL